MKKLWRPSKKARPEAKVAARNEVLCKTLCHKICCNISAIYELGIEPEFGLSDAT